MNNSYYLIENICVGDRQQGIVLKEQSLPPHAVILCTLNLQTNIGRLANINQLKNVSERKTWKHTLAEMLLGITI